MAAMADKKHLKIMLSGSYVAGPLATETWACNIREALVFGSVDDIGQFPDSWDVVPDFRTVVDSGNTYTTTWHAHEGAHDFDPVDYLINQAEPAIANWMAGAGFSAHAQLEKISLYPCDATGNAIGGNNTQCTLGTPVVGPTSGNNLPTENTVAVSWQTHIIGPMGRGRIFTPLVPASALGAYGLLSSGFASTLLNGSKNMLEGLALTGVGLGEPSVRPVVTGPTVKVGHPAYTVYGTIVEVKVGQVVDTQRRRRNKLPESYVVDYPSY
jgi:hypothetical protein